MFPTVECLWPCLGRWREPSMMSSPLYMNARHCGNRFLGFTGVWAWHPLPLSCCTVWNALLSICALCHSGAFRISCGGWCWNPRKMLRQSSSQCMNGLDACLMLFPCNFAVSFLPSNDFSSRIAEHCSSRSGSFIGGTSSTLKAAMPNSVVWLCSSKDGCFLHTYCDG